MSTLKVSEIKNAATTAGGISIDSSGAVSGGLPTPNRNLLYNGAMQVAQRGTSVTGITNSGIYTADRWGSAHDSLGTWTQTVESDAPSGSGLRKSLKWLCTTASAAPGANAYLLMNQKLEGQDVQRIKKGTSSAEQLSLSFWVKSNVTGTYIAEIRDADNSRTVSAAYTVSASGTWERKTLTFPADTTGVLDNDNAVSLEVDFWLAAGSTFSSGTLGTTWGTTAANRAVGQTNLAAATNNYWQITGVQLEVGDTATGFEFKPFGQELAECQRYYYLHAEKGGTQTIGIATYVNTSQARASVFFPVTMRSAPSVEAASGTNYYTVSVAGGSDTLNSLQIVNATKTTCGVYNSSEASSTAGYSGWLYTSDANAYVAFSAEL